jgi:hypothetical protein
MHKKLDYVYQAIRLTRLKLNGQVPLIGFVGAPWTLMAYMIEGKSSRTWHNAKAWFYSCPDKAAELLAMLADACAEFLIGQQAAGAQLLQVFDTNAGELPLDIFNRFIMPGLVSIAAKVKAACPDTPLICFPKGANHANEELARTSKYDVIGLDWGVDRAAVRKAITEPGLASVQGNMDPAVLYAGTNAIQAEVASMLDGFGTQRYICNMGHGMHPSHTPEQALEFVSSMQRLSYQKAAIEVLGVPRNQLTAFRQVTMIKVASRDSPLAKIQVDELLYEMRASHMPGAVFTPFMMPSKGDKNQKVRCCSPSCSLLSVCLFTTTLKRFPVCPQRTRSSLFALN